MSAIGDIATERRRQIEVEGNTPGHDDWEHRNGELAFAAACYAISSPMQREDGTLWPWSWEFWKPKDRRRDLVRAGALIVAEIERLDRAADRVANTSDAVLRSLREMVELCRRVNETGFCNGVTGHGGRDEGEYWAGQVIQRAMDAIAATNCSRCGKPADTVACGVGGCPLERWPSGDL